MDYDAVLAQVLTLLQQEQRVAYRIGLNIAKLSSAATCRVPIRLVATKSARYVSE